MDGNGSALRRLRRARDLSAARVAELVGVSTHTVYNWERGTTPVPLAQLRRMATLYRVPLVRLAAAGGVRCPRELDLKTWRPGDLGRVLRVLREWSGLTQSELALRIGASRDAVRAWESGRYQPGPPLRLTLEELYRLPVGGLQRAYAGGEALAQPRVSAL